MNRLFAALVAGLLFGLGLAISDMANPAKVLNFLDPAGRWDPTLGVVLLAALAIATPVFAWVRRRGRALDGTPLPTPPATRIDRRLLAGSAVFGIGWGIAGYCPGTAVANIAGGSVDAAWFLLAMLAGMLATRRFVRDADAPPSRGAGPGTGTAVVAGATSLGALCALLLAASPAPASAQQPATAPVTVFAAASLKESLDEAAAAYRQRTGQQVRVSYGASSALARQIEQGAPADVFFSADLDWMDDLQQRGLVDVPTRRNLLGNTLVLVAPIASTAKPVALRRGTDLRPLLGADGRIALALTASVPAGKYAKAAFESLGMWPTLETRVAEAENVRAALLLVARGEAPLGVVYGSDALAEPRVRVVATFPADSHPPIVYPVARLSAGTQPQAARFVQWLQSERAKAIFRKHGFSTP